MYLVAMKVALTIAMAIMNERRNRSVDIILVVVTTTVIPNLSIIAGFDIFANCFCYVSAILHSAQSSGGVCGQ